jgi:hypothetical protein
MNHGEIRWLLMDDVILVSRVRSAVPPESHM